MKQVHVVTVFLCHKGKICLVRRSKDVRTYQGRWSGISGYLEGDPMEHFRVEIQEETSLTPYEYTLLRCAPPIEIPDEKHDQLWYVHPFLCEVADPGRISLDWENSELEWIEPEGIKHRETVPALWEVYEKVSRLPLEKETLLLWQQLRQDRDSGARQIAIKALAFLLSVCERSNAASVSTLVDDLRYVCEHLGSSRPSMAIISTTLNLVLFDVRQVKNADIKATSDTICRIIAHHRQEMEYSLSHAVRHLDEIIPYDATVLVHSYSSSLVSALGYLKEKHCRLIVSEARPSFEGRITARIAAEKGLAVTLITDALAAHALKGADVVLLGADSIEQDGSVINKAGSKGIAMAAYTAGVKVYFLGEMRKICLNEESVELEEGHVDEVWEDAPEGVAVCNIYFDRTPPRYITGIILEQGIVEPYQIKKIAHSMRPYGSD